LVASFTTFLVDFFAAALDFVRLALFRVAIVVSSSMLVWGVQRSDPL
jgi:hypothetical protein